MSLLAQAISGGIAGAANTGSAMLQKKMEMDYQTERDRATALREENLLRLKQSLSDDSEVRKHAMVNADAPSQYFDPDTGARLTNKEAEQYDKSTLLGEEAAKEQFKVDPDYRITGADGISRPANRAQIQDNAAANENIGLINSQAAARAKAAQDDLGDPALRDLVDPKDIEAAKQAGNLTPKEQDIADSWKGDAGKITSDKKDAITAKAENAVNLMELKYNNLKEITDSKLAAAKEISDAKLQMAGIIAQMRIAASNGKHDDDNDAKVTESQRKVLAKEADTLARLQGAPPSPDIVSTLNAARGAVGLDSLPQTATQDEIDALKAQAVANVKAKHGVKSFFGMVPDKEEVKTEVQRLKTGGLVNSKPATATPTSKKPPLDSFWKTE
jgi:hypothetical protein